MGMLSKRYWPEGKVPVFQWGKQHGLSGRSINNYLHRGYFPSDSSLEKHGSFYFLSPDEPLPEKIRERLNHGHNAKGGHDSGGTDTDIDMAIVRGDTL